MSETKRIDRAEIAKHIERAEKLLQKGKPAEALEEYLNVLASEQENDTVRQMAADLCLSLQRVPDAVRLLGPDRAARIEVDTALREDVGRSLVALVHIGKFAHCLRMTYRAGLPSGFGVARGAQGR